MEVQYVPNEAVVWVKAWEKIQVLKGFEPMALQTDLASQLVTMLPDRNISVDGVGRK